MKASKIRGGYANVGKLLVSFNNVKVYNKSLQTTELTYLEFYYYE